jgi:hypothetical protein
MNNQVTLATISAATISNAVNADWRGDRALAYTFVPVGEGGSIVKTYGVPVESPALRGAIAWALRRSGRQVDFSARSDRAIGFEQV